MAYKSNTTYILFGIILTVSSCSQEYAESDGPREQGTRIEFKAALPEVSSRAVVITKDLLNEFQASAFTVGESSETTYFPIKTFGLNANTGKYINYDPECIWPNNNDVLRFAAFAPSCSDMINAGGGASMDGCRLTGFYIPQKIESQFDFITAIAKGRLIENEETGISLTFQHQLSRIQLMAWGDSPNFDLEIAGARIGGIGTGGTFNITAPDGAVGSTQGGTWESVTKGYVEYIYRTGDKTVTIDGNPGTPTSAEDAVSILGANIGGENGYYNSAMVIPSDNASWQYKTDPSNGNGGEEGMYISVLLRVTDDTPYETQGDVIYPILGNENTVYLAVDSQDQKTVSTRVYRIGDDYYTDLEDLNSKYDPPANGTEVKAYGWVALPVAENLKPGCIYTFTLNYSGGVGVLDPHDPEAGDPVINERVLVNVNVADWLPGTANDVTVPRK